MSLQQNSSIVMWFNVSAPLTRTLHLDVIRYRCTRHAGILRSVVEKVDDSFLELSWFKKGGIFTHVAGQV
jgi:hypothetical protein